MLKRITVTCTCVIEDEKMQAEVMAEALTQTMMSSVNAADPDKVCILGCALESTIEDADSAPVQPAEQTGPAVIPNDTQEV